MHTIEALLFDLYGTLVIRQERQFLREVNKYYLPVSHQSAMLSKLGEFGLELIRKLMVTDLDTHKLPADLLAMFPHATSETLDDLRHSFRDALRLEASATRLIPGVKTLLAFFRKRGYKIGVVSNASTLHKQPLFDFDLDRFLDASIFSCDVGYAKPEPAMYLIACQRLNVAPEHVLFVGDSYNMDVKKPRDLGMQAMHVSKAQRYQHRLSHITELGLWRLEPELCSFIELFNRRPELRDRRIRIGDYSLFPHHPDRAWLTYLCSGTENEQPHDFYVQRAITLSSESEPVINTESFELVIANEVFRVTPCL